MLPIANGKIIDLTTLETRNRTITDKFNYECTAEYISLSSEDEQFAKKYFMDLFCNNSEIMQYVLDIFKSALTGEKIRNIFFCTGSGRNGKSLLFKLLHIILDKTMDVINEKVIIETQTNSALNTEAEKLDKIRIAFMSELKEGQQLNSTMIKQISGGDPINLRTLNRSDCTINPTCNLFVLTNVLPIFKVDEAMVDRIIIIPFNNKFPIDKNYENELISKKNVIFSYILKYGKIQNSFNSNKLPKEMQDATKNYVDDNINDYLDEFLENKIEKKNGANIKRDIFRKEFNFWCKEMGYPFDKRTDRSFSQSMKKKGIECSPINGVRCYKNISIIED